MKISIRYLRWIFLVLYAALVVSLTAVAYFPKRDQWILWLLGIMVVSQLIFIFGAGTNELWQPIGPRRRLLPAIVASLMFGLLAWGLLMAVGEWVEVVDLDNNAWFDHMGLAIAGFNWVAWGILFYLHTRNMERFKAIQRMTHVVLAGSLFQLFVTVPAHMIVSKRPGCFVGMYTMMGVIAGIFVMMWAFGPGIVLLFFPKKPKP